MRNPIACFSIEGEGAFRRQAMEVFRYQSMHIPVYKDYLKAIRVDPEKVQHWEDIPYLPVSFFKTHDICEEGATADVIFSSSGTTGQIPSRHRVADIRIYEQSFLKAFELFYGDIREYCLLALLPSYLERKGSSLVFMTERLIRESRHEDSGFYMHQYEQLAEVLKRQRDKKQRTILLGVSYALLEMAEKFPMDFPELIVMETGGMKGKRQEMIREDLHELLRRGFNVPQIHSEYGMTELLSQAYSKDEGKFQCPPWMKVRIREINDPFAYVPNGSTGGICITDLANVHSSAFIAVEDIGRMHADNHFEVLGRFDNSEHRGCNLMYF